MHTRWMGILMLAASLPNSPSLAAAVQPQELATAHRWAASKFAGAAEPGLLVIRNYATVEKDARYGAPLKLGSTTYQRGLYCHAPSRIIVHLPGPGASFAAVVGVDANACEGSVVFSVLRGAEVAFRSDVLRPGAAQTVNVDLGGATSFTLEVADADDGINCDQADWADAQVTLSGGRTLWLSELPLAETPFDAQPEAPFFSFVYDGKPSAELLGTWPLTRTSRRLDAVRTQHELTWRDPASQLVVRCVAVEYADFPTVEWTVHFRNAGDRDTPILENIQALDLHCDHGHPGDYLLHHFAGSASTIRDYAPLLTRLTPGFECTIGAGGGLPQTSDMAYFNLATPLRRGVLIAVGWPGQWAARWQRDAATGLHVVAGQELTHLKLRPAEEIRTPLIALQFWVDGDWQRAQNVWRQWMLAHNTPPVDGRPAQPRMFGSSAHITNEMCRATESNQRSFLDRFLTERIPISHWWMDAGWYPCGDPADWGITGTWEVDAQRFPHGLRPITDYAHAHGLKTILWFDPEMVRRGTWLAEQHPEWLLGDGELRLLNLGDPDALAWVQQHISSLLVEQGIDVYRQDMNFDPLRYWRDNDAPDRQGITENKHVVGYLAYWDYLRAHVPGLVIDSCASGGRRNDLESLRRALPLWRTDYRCEPTGTQCATYGVSYWLPLTGTAASEPDTYVFRSNMSPFPSLMLNNLDAEQNYALLRTLTDQWRQVAPYYLGDYTPLTPYSTDDDTWMAWQFHRADLGAGMVQAFRRPGSACAAIGFQLRGLEPDATYMVRNLDAPAGHPMSGKELMDKYLLIEITSRPGAALYAYERMR